MTKYHVRIIVTMIRTVLDTKYMDLLSYLIEARTKQGLTIRDVALRIGEPFQFVGRVETAERRLNVYEYVQYCEALNLDPSEGLKLLFRDKT